jgi:outer membrane protein TolC
MGVAIDKSINLTETLESLVQKNTDLSLYATTFNLDNHIDYKIAQNSVTASELLMKFEKSKALPSLSAFVNYGVTANNDAFKFTDSDQKWFGSSLFGVSLNVPIFSSFKRDAKTQQAKNELKQSQIKLDDTAQKLRQQVVSSKTNYQFAIDNYQTTKENLTLAESIEKKEQIKFFEGVGTSFNLSQAQNQLYTIQQQYLQAIVEIINAKVNLENALNNNQTTK